ncbi:MAG: DMT family transporter [Pseudomonadota bacterium]
MAEALPIRRSGQGMAWATLVAVGLGWGGAQLLTKISVGTGHDAISLTFWQAMIGTLLFTLAQLATGRPLPLSRRHLVFYAVCGVLGTTLPHTLSYISIRHLSVGVQSLVLATVPMMTLCLALLLREERFEMRRALGLGLGLFAMLAIALPDASLPAGTDAAWILLPVIVSLAYAGENVYIARYKPAGLNALGVMCGLSWAALLMLAPAAAMVGPLVPPTLGVSEAALAGVAVLHVLSYFGFVWLIGRAGSVFAAQVAYVVTASGIGWGMLVLDERHSLWIWAALALVFGGLALVTPRERD